MDEQSIPETDADLTPEWLTAALGRRVDAVRAEVLGEGIGVMGSVRRLHLSGDPGLPATVIAKLPAPPGPNRATATTYGFYVREVEFYRRAAPAMDLRVPACLAASMAADGTGVPFVLLLEDVVAGRAVDQLAGCELADAQLIVDEVARLHARWWDDPALGDMAWLPPVDNAAYRGYQQAIPQLAPLLRAKYGERLEPEGFAVVDRLADGGYLEFLAFWERTGPLTFTHYDVRLDNVLFEDDRVCLLDWQLAVRHRGTFDLAYLLGQNVTPAFRRQHQDSLLRRYHETLVGLGVKSYSFDHCWDDYRAAMVMHVASAMQLAVLDGGNDRGQQLIDSMLTSGWTAAVELDAAEVVFR